MRKIGPPSFQRWVVDRLTFMKNLQRLKRITDTIHATSVEILAAKRKAIEEGDEAMTNQIGSGKDIISILRMSLIYPTNTNGI